jgi:hypothetical protein
MADALTCNNVMSSFNAVAYAMGPLAEEMTSFNEDEPDQIAKGVDLDYERPFDQWDAIASKPDQAKDPRLPRVFIDGSVESQEIAGSPQDGMGYARSIRAGEVGAGAISLDAPEKSRISCNRFVAISSAGYAPSQILPLEQGLLTARIPFQLTTWDPSTDGFLRSYDEKEAAARDAVMTRTSVRRRARTMMLEMEERLTRGLEMPVYVDGRYADHLPAYDGQFVVGIIKTMRQRYLDPARSQVLYGLKPGERTPAFSSMSAGTDPAVSFYVRICSLWGGATNGLVRVEVGRGHFENWQNGDFDLLSAIAAHLTRLRTTDTTYERAAVTVEPIRVIEGRIQRLFHPREKIAMAALNALRGA